MKNTTSFWATRLRWPVFDRPGNEVIADGAHPVPISNCWLVKLENVCTSLSPLEGVERFWLIWRTRSYIDEGENPSAYCWSRVFAGLIVIIIFSFFFLFLRSELVDRLTSSVEALTLSLDSASLLFLFWYLHPTTSHHQTWPTGKAAPLRASGDRAQVDRREKEKSPTADDDQHKFFSTSRFPPRSTRLPVISSQRFRPYESRPQKSRHIEKSYLESRLSISRKTKCFAPVDTIGPSAKIATVEMLVAAGVFGA